MSDQIKLKVNKNTTDRFRSAILECEIDWSERNEFFTNLTLRAIESGLHLDNVNGDVILKSSQPIDATVGQHHEETRKLVGDYCRLLFHHLKDHIHDSFMNNSVATSRTIDDLDDRIGGRLDDLRNICEKQFRRFVMESKRQYTLSKMREIKRSGLFVSLLGIGTEFASWCTGNPVGLPSHITIALIIAIGLKIALDWRHPLFVVPARAHALDQQDH